MSFTDEPFFSQSDMRSKQDKDVTIIRDVLTESTPTCISSEWNTSKTTKVEDFPPTISKNLSNIFLEAVMIQFIRTRTLSHESVLWCHFKILHGLID